MKKITIQCRDVSRIWFKNHCLKKRVIFSKPYSDASQNRKTHQRHIVHFLLCRVIRLYIANLWIVIVVPKELGATQDRRP